MTNPIAIFSLEGRCLNYLGQISYGLYMYHCFIIVGLLLLLPTSKAMLFNGLLYGASFLGSIAVAAISYHYYEMPFLRLKTLFESK